jgi:hypothetical protein
MRGVFLALPACVLVPLAALAADAPATGSIAGVVRFTGPLPPGRKVLTTEGQTLLHRDLVVDPRTKGLRDVAAVLEDAPAQPRATYHGR